MMDGSSFMLDNIRYVSELRRNLISLGTLKKRGFYREDTVGQDQGYKGFTGGIIRNKKSYLRIYLERSGSDQEDIKGWEAVKRISDWSGMSKVLWAEDTTMSTYLVNRSPLSAIGFKTPVDMLGFFCWLAIKQGMLEPVKVVLYRNMGFNESGEYKKTFIGSGVGTSSVQVLQGVEFEVEPQEDHTFKVEPHGNVDHVVGSQEVQTQDLILSFST
ncbi:hypothetical protein Tco_0733851 [Tanacetum coccineum]